MDVQALVDQCNGQLITVTGPDAGQCTAIPHKWSTMLGLPIVFGNAKDTFANAPTEFYEVVANTPDNFPPPGANVVFGAPWGGGYGHTGTVTSANANEFWALEQNNPTGSVAHIVNHKNYSGVIGWFIPKVTNQGTTNVPTQLLTADQARDFYHIILGREPENGAVLTGRDALEFVYSSQNEVTAGRQATASQVQSMRDQIKAQQDLIDSSTNQHIRDLTQANVDLNVRLSAAPAVPTATPAPTKHDSFWSTTQGRGVLGVLATLITPAILALQNAQPKDALLAAVILGAVTLLQGLKDLLNPGVPNTTK